ncbi:aminoacyltransferase [Streptococcus penaeicida]|uniref:aminoacyltransferase n=1 Tax=Streptococcus penaeicida TaxID=1765960 RepID=UPI0039F0AEA1
MFTYKVGIPKEEHDAFVLGHPNCNLLQSANWASVKEEWKQEIIGFYENEELVASAALLIRPLPLNFSLIYIPRGPIMDYTNFELVDFVINSLRKFGKSKKALFVKFDPSLFLKQFPVDKEITDVEENDLTLSAISFMKSHGIEWTGRTEDIGQNIQPRLQANLYAKDFDLVNFPKKTRQAIRTAQNKGVTITIGGQELLEDFAELMKKTESRKGINLRGIDYYRTLMETYPGEQSYITMAKVNMVERKALLETQIMKALSEKEKFTEKTRESKVKENFNTITRLTSELELIQNDLDSGKETVPLAATLSLNFGQTSENLYAGMDDSYKVYQAPLLTWYETAAEAFRRGCQWQNMGGIENQLNGGLYSFKAKLNPQIEEFAGEFNIPVSLFYHPAMLAYKIRKKLRSKH